MSISSSTNFANKSTFEFTFCGGNLLTKSNNNSILSVLLSYYYKINSHVYKCFLTFLFLNGYTQVFCKFIRDELTSVTFNSNSIKDNNDNNDNNIHEYHAE